MEHKRISNPHALDSFQAGWVGASEDWSCSLRGSGTVLALAIVQISQLVQAKGLNKPTASHWETGSD